MTPGSDHQEIGVLHSRDDLARPPDPWAFRQGREQGRRVVRQFDQARLSIRPEACQNRANQSGGAGWHAEAAGDAKGRGMGQNVTLSTANVPLWSTNLIDCQPGFSKWMKARCLSCCDDRNNKANAPEKSCEKVR